MKGQINIQKHNTKIQLDNLKTIIDNGIFEQDYWVFKRLLAIMMSQNHYIWKFFHDVTKGVAPNKRVDISEKADYASDFMNAMFELTGALDNIFKEIEKKWTSFNHHSEYNGYYSTSYHTKITNLFYDDLFSGASKEESPSYYMSLLGDSYFDKEVHKELFNILLDAICSFDNIATKYCMEIEPRESKEDRWKYIEKEVAKIRKQNKKTYLLSF